MSAVQPAASAIGRSRSYSKPRGHRSGIASGWVWFALPSLLLIAVFFLLPFVLNGYLSFTQWTSFSSKISLNGLENFIDLQRQDVFVNAVVVTLLYAMIGASVQNGVGLSLALLLQETNLVNSFFRSLYFLPVLISPLAAGYIWAGVFDPNGPLNDFIGLMIGRDFNYAWLGHGATAVVTVAFVDAWKWCGFATLIYIAGLNSIPRNIMEQAEIDGANAWQRFRNILVPLLAPAFTFNIVITLIGAFNAYDVIMSTTKGGPGNSTEALNVAMWRQWSQGMFGMASSLSFTIAMLVVAIGIPLIWWLRRREIEL